MEFAYWRFENQNIGDFGKYPEDEERARQEPEFDYFEAHPPVMPKLEIGEYVRSQGFNVPIIDTQEEWQEAFDKGNAMLRSEFMQDYDGLSGLCGSLRIIPELYFPKKDDESYYGRLGRILVDGLRSGELPAIEYMSRLRGYASWDRSQLGVQQAAMYFGVRHDIGNPSVSMWKYIEGTNVKIFTDPHVKGRYHFGVMPPDEMYGGQASIGDYQYELGEYDDPRQFRKHDTPFVPRPYIEVYEAIRSLPSFDNTDCPVMELQGDHDGKIHFLQYLKTGQKINCIEPFEIKATKDAIRTTNVRGITPPGGKSVRLFLGPKRLAPQMQGEGIYFTVNRPRGIEQQFAAINAGFILNDAHVSFKDNHFSSSPLYRPPLAAGYDGLEGTGEHMFETLKNVREQVLRHPFTSDDVLYVDIHVTSNGRELAIESDWEVESISYLDLA